MPGGTSAGTILGLNFFLVMFNKAGPPANTISIGRQIAQPRRGRKPIEKCKVKWIDDMTLCNAVNLKTALVREDRPVSRPLPFHARTEHRLPRNRNSMQDELDELSKYTENHLMAINKMKTKAMLCNSRTKWDFVPELTLDGHNNLEIVDEVKIVGFILRNDMKTCSNTTYITTKAYKRMWLIRRLKAMGASTTQLLDCLQKQILSVLWLGAPAWYCMLTQYEKNDLDRVLKVGLRIIYGDSYGGFENALLLSMIKRPTVMLSKITEKFALKSMKHEKFRHWFQEQDTQTVNTRRKKNKYVDIYARTDRYGRSPIPQLTSLLNKKISK